MGSRPQTRARAGGSPGLHLRRQQVIDGFVVDFYCHRRALVVEVDGGVHERQTSYDGERDRLLAERGLRLLRVPNEEVRRPDGRAGTARGRRDQA